MIKGIINNIPKDIKRVAMPIGGIDKGWEVRDSQDHLIWGRQETISGSTPLSFTSGNGDAISSWSLLGNGQQTGTPTPDAPIMPTFCGKQIDTDWIIPITCAGQTTPVYLGQVSTVRRIKKLVLTGNESWSYQGGSIMPFRVMLAESMQLPTRADIFWICSHFTSISHDGAAKSGAQMSQFICWHPVDNQGYLRFRNTDAETVADFKSYLASQYAAGTPVTVWYVLATPETAIVNEPLCKIGDYADELHSEDAGVTIPTTRGQNALTVDTDLQPSSMTISGHIK